MEYYQEVSIADSVAAFRSPQMSLWGDVRVSNINFTK